MMTSWGDDDSPELNCSGRSSLEVGDSAFRAVEDGWLALGRPAIELDESSLRDVEGLEHPAKITENANAKTKRLARNWACRERCEPGASSEGTRERAGARVAPPRAGAFAESFKCFFLFIFESKP
jgi:hypothetical protein